MNIPLETAGYIEGIYQTEGTVIPSGSVVMRLVPLNEPLKAEVFVINKDVGFVIPGQKP
jgi:HlyD family secretion protein